MIPRIADHSFWMFRYLERGEILARLLSATHLAEMDFNSLSERKELILLTLSQEKNLFLKLYNVKAIDIELILYFLIWQELNPNSLSSLFKSARQNAQLIREVISEQMWREINALYLYLGKSPQDTSMHERHDFYAYILGKILRCKGHFYNSLHRDDYFYLMEIGSLYERVMQVYHMLNSLPLFLTDKESEAQFEILNLLLECFASTENYLKWEAGFQLEAFVEFFLQDKSSPYSLQYGLNKIAQNFASLSTHSKLPKPDIIFETTEYLSNVLPATFLDPNENEQKQTMRELLNQINSTLQTSLSELSVV